MARGWTDRTSGQLTALLCVKEHRSNFAPSRHKNAKPMESFENHFSLDHGAHALDLKRDLDSLRFLAPAEQIAFLATVPVGVVHSKHEIYM